MNKIVENYLREYSKVVDDFLKKDEAVVERNYFFFKNFYKKENLEKASWEDLQQMGKHIHAFNSMAIARSKALGNPTQPVEKYREALMYLVYGTDPIDEKIHRIQLDEGYSLPGFGRSALTELACYTNPEEYLFLNSRDMKATEFLGITFSKKGKAGAKFIAFNKAIKPLIESYKSIIGKRTNTTIPLEVDQFLSWIYINYVPDDENLDDSDIEESIEDVLEPFLLQAQTENLKTSEYPKTYQGLNLKVSFGQGNTAKIPWISFLGNNQTTSNGIYPVYLLYKEFQKLILAYGVSETNIPKSKWLLDSNLKTIGQFFSEEGLKPDRYGESYVHSAYDLSEELDWTRINNDLNALINIYKKRILSIETISTVLYLRQPLEILKIRKDLDSACLQINESLATRYVCSLLTKKFLILTGLAGSGKTKLAQAFATWICENENQYKIVPVGADWTSREPLFGYPNALEHNKYILPDSGVLSLILKASKSENQNKPYFLIL
ncbi:MAG TPA: DUF3578 domain-containing protein, partial [Cyclobacteriaceae bacterium]|nr:DUF3578 domain-containing protein [Cyclobacteriaceae bacterium]